MSNATLPQPEALDDLYLKLHGMSKRLESSGRIDESDAPEAYPAILDAMNLVRKLQCESARVAALTAPAQPGSEDAGYRDDNWWRGWNAAIRHWTLAILEQQRTRAAATAQPAPVAQAGAGAALDLPDPIATLAEYGGEVFTATQMCEFGNQQFNAG